jgi:hypothetical protein
MLSAYLPPLRGVCLVRVKKNGSNGFIVQMNPPAASDEAPARAGQWRGMIPAAGWLRTSVVSL